MRPRKIYAVYEYYEDYHEIRFMFYDKDTAKLCAELLRKQQDLNNHIEAQLEEFGVERVYKDNSIFTVEEWDIADGDTVPVIKCKDCKYYTGKWCTKFSTKQFDINDICKDNNDFCSMAERKEECSR